LRRTGVFVSISPPSDIILDVARAADPAALRVATARLAPAPAPAGKFDAALAAEGPRPVLSGATLRAEPQLPSSIPTAYRDFEAMILASLITSAMPEDETLFGSGTAGGVWKSVFVQEVGKAVAARGGVGIAAALARDVRLTPTSSEGAAAATAVRLASPWPTAAPDVDDVRGNR
jgi:flagellar protein FlgJ